MRNIKIIALTLIFFLFSVNLYGSGSITLNKINIDLEDYVSLQKGAKVYFNKCQGCHSLKYMRYIDLANGIGLKGTKKKSLTLVIQDTLMHSNKNIKENDNILSTISKESGIKWFGKAIPDLSLISRYRGEDWLYTYMLSFYKDLERPWGVNNLIFPDVGMPHILLKLQGIQILNKKKTNNTIDSLELIENGDLSKEEYNDLVKDLVTFLSYVGEPIQIERNNIGSWVLIYLFIFTILTYFLKRRYWENIK